MVLKWGTLKEWRLNSQKGQELLRRYFELGDNPGGAMMQRDTPEQKALILQMIDECSAGKILIDWENKQVSKEEAKRYVQEYGVLD